MRYGDAMIKLATLVIVMIGARTVYAVEPTIDLAKALKDVVAKYPVRPIQTSTLAPGCTPPTSAERSAVEKRALAWIDAQHPTEIGATSKTGLELVVNMGCKDASGAIVLDISQDRTPKHPRSDFDGTRRNYLLRVTPTAIDVIAEDISTYSMNWMEWADEGRIVLLAQVDVDGDGALDIVYSDHEHEGGAMDTHDTVRVRFATGRTGEGAQVDNLGGVAVMGGTFVVSGRTRSDRVIYVCMGRDLRLAPCAAARPLQAVADRERCAHELVFDPGELPDRDRLATCLTLLGVPPKRRSELVAAAPETQPSDRVHRMVIEFLVKAHLVEPAPMPAVIRQRHPDSRVYLDKLASTLGDTACTRTPLAADDAARAQAWIEKQQRDAQDPVVAPTACGPYVWVSWRGDSGVRRQALLGRDGSRILGFTFEQEMPGGSALGHIESWFVHAGTLVGIAHDAQNLWVVANGKVVAQTKGAVALYRADDRWDETASSIFVDDGTLWHATPTGRERLDRTLVKDHEARRAAIALLSQRSSPPIDAKYIAALQLLGADKALIAEAKKLP